MEDREENLIKQIIKMQKTQNTLKPEEQIENYKKEIIDTGKFIEKSKSEITNLTTQLNDLKNKDTNNDSENKQTIEQKKFELNNLLRANEIKKNQLKYIQKNNENFSNQDYILELIKHWSPQTMFKYTQLYDKKN